MTQNSIDFHQIAEAALSDADTLVPAWLPQGKRSGHEWQCGSLRGEPGNSLSVNLNTGVWCDFATGEKGADLISLYAAIYTNDEQGKAAKELAEKLSITVGQLTQAPRKKRVVSAWQPIQPVPVSAKPAPVAHPVRGRPTHTWDYLGSEGELLGRIYRFTTSDGGKEVLPCVWAKNADTGQEDWRWLQFSVPRPLYGLHELKGQCRYVLVVEGEKCRDAAAQAFEGSFEVVSWPGGGKAVSKAYWEVLRGRKVIIWPDCDAKKKKDSDELLPEMPIKGQASQPGVKAAEDIAEILIGLDCEVRIVSLPAPGAVVDGWDVVDALEEGTSPADLRAWIYENLRQPASMVQAKEQGSTKQEASAPSQAGAARGGWRNHLIQGARGGFMDCKENVALALSHCSELKGLVGFNEFSGRIERLKAAPWSERLGEWTTVDDLELSMFLATEVNLLFKSTGTISEGVHLAAHRNPIHPVREYLTGLDWDGTDRAATWLHTYLGTQDGDYESLVGQLWLRQAVRRILEPGCKADYTLILEGGQGAAKSTSLRVLGGEWFSDAALDLNSKEACQQIFGTWIYEIAELDAFNRAESTRIKAFLTQNFDRYRPPYERRQIVQLRQTVFAATTNFSEYHKDPTGNRRFWSVRCGNINLEALRKDRDQILAQAVWEVQNGYRSWPTRDEERDLIVPEQQMREIVDPWAEAIAEWVDEGIQYTKDQFTSAQLLEGAIGMELSRIDGQRSATTRIGTIMMRMGWKKIRASTGPRQYFYCRPEKSKEGNHAKN